MEASERRHAGPPKKRRRRDTRLPIQARLRLDDRAKGNFGYISRDLVQDLFGAVSADSTVHIAIAPWQPPSISLQEDCKWTILPVKLAGTDFPPSSIRFPTSSLAIQNLQDSLQSSGGFSSIPRGGSGLEILVLDVEPLALHTIFVKVDGQALKKHGEVQRKFGGGFQPKENGHASKGKGKAVERAGAPGKSLDDELRDAVRAGLGKALLVHKGDAVFIPLLAHPITHVPFPPIEISFCEPVDQGVVAAQTKIVIELDLHARASTHRNVLDFGASPASQQAQAVAEESEDTSAEQFYSAAEQDGETGDSGRHRPTITNGASETEDSETDSEGNSDDDSGDNLISMSAPTLPPQASGVLSSMTAATPRPFARTNGIATPGSVYSSYTTTTARGGPPPGKSFEIKSLIKSIPDAILHPQPGSDDDDEARIFVDVKTLARIGCFSGDWVKISTAGTPAVKERLWPAGAFGYDETEENSRVVKIYGLPDISANEALHAPKNNVMRRGSISSVLAFSRPSLGAYVSPVLFSNLGKPKSLTISPIFLPQSNDKKTSRAKLPSTAAPPAAKEITFVKVMTPTTTERTSQVGEMAALKQHFERRRRLLRTGDLLAVSMDLTTSRMFSDTTAAKDGDTDLDELLATPPSLSGTTPSQIGVAWFKIGQITSSFVDDRPVSSDPMLWSHIASFEPGFTGLRQSGSEQSLVPSTRDVPWDYYLGTRQRPKAATPTAGPVETISQVPEPYVPALQRRLKELFAVASSARAAHLKMQPIVILLHSTQRSIGKSTLVSRACADLGLHCFATDAYDILTEGGAGGGDVKTEGALRAKIERAMLCGARYTVPLIRHAEALSADRMASALKEMLGEMKMLVLTTTGLGKVSDSLRALVTHELEVSAPDEIEREGILSSIIGDRSIRLAPDVDLSSVAVKTAALVAGDLADVIDRAAVARQVRLEDLAAQTLSSPASEPSTPRLIRDLLVSGGSSISSLTASDFTTAVDLARKSFADSIGAPKIPNVTWDDVGGLSHIKHAVSETISLPLTNPELFAKGMKKRSGILFYGPPGTGKTLLAKAIATEYSLNFFSIKGPELLNMYIGESEANVRRVFQRARDARPCVVFFDELDSVAPKRGNQGDSGGVMDRIVSQLLAELDGMSDGGDEGSSGGGGGVFVIGATNRPDLLDQALLRPGRFDKMLYLGVSDTHDKQLTILEALTRKFALHPDCSLKRVAERLPFTYTGADLYALCSDAMLKAITRQANAVDDKIRRIKEQEGRTITPAYFFDHLARDEDVKVEVCEEDFMVAQRELVGSVSAKELEHYQRVRATFESPDTSANTKSSSTENATPTTQSHMIQPSHTSTPPRVLPSRVRPSGGPRQLTAIRGNGNGKAMATYTDSSKNINGNESRGISGEEEEADDDDDEAYVTSNDYGSPPYRGTNGSAKGKGKEKAPIRDGGSDGFGNPADGDEEDLYGSES